MKKRGFTLIELLVVISIIALLAAIVFANLATARAKARDAQRFSELHQIQNAIELYTNDHGSPPGWSTGWWAEINNTSFQTCTSACGTDPQPGPVTALVPKYISKIPDDPLSPGPTSGQNNADQGKYFFWYGRGFRWDGNGNLIYPQNNNRPGTYVICTQLETQSVASSTFDNPWGKAAGWGSLNYCVGN